MQPLRPQGLYDPAYDHDACGVGMICNIAGTPSHEIIRDGLDLLINLDHRGACGCDEDTGDGAGIMMQVPDAFLRARCADHGIALPDPGDYGVGLVFLPTDAAQQRVCRQWVAEVVAAEGQRLLGWRRVPVVSEVVGVTARSKEPAMWQVFVGRGSNTGDAAAFERKLYVIRRVLEQQARTSTLPDRDAVYVASLSSRTLVYKGMLTTHQLPAYFPDLADPLMASAMALVHSRFSTNTFPRWSLAHPFRFLCHNGEINTLRGNVNWMRARERLFRSDRFGDDLEKLLPVLTDGLSDSATLDNALELLYFSGRELPHAVMMLIPEAWEHDATMPDPKRAFYQYHACLMEPWDGPATIPFSDGRYVGAVLDRNGLRPSRYTLTKDGRAILASETGVLDVDPANVLEKGRLQPGRMFLVDLEDGRVVPDAEIKDRISTRRPYRQWLDDHLLRLDDLPDAQAEPPDLHDVERAQRRFGYTREDLRLLLAPMAQDGKEALGSMGDDAPLAVLSEQPRLLYDYFRQLFAQVTNPPLDAIREKLVTSLYTYMGFEG
ncbi:MAG: glutamate synthase subunit alpha, partial [Bacteroidetes bacterium]|nr:glutamate synthase subunit alpha [Bacteroidota bacterium]